VTSSPSWSPVSFCNIASSLRAREEAKTCLRRLSGLGHDRGTDRNRRASASLSPVLIHFRSPTSFLYQKLQQFLQQDPGGATHSLMPMAHRHQGPAKPQHGIPAVEWPTVLRRVIEHQEPLRKVADDYGVSYETIRRIVLAARKQSRTG